MLLMALLAACGNRATTSTTTPIFFYVHSVAFNTDGNLFAWGSNTYGQLGNGDTGGNSQLSPIPIAFTNVFGVSAGGTHTLACQIDGSVWAWGNNGFGQLGDNTTDIRFSPVQVLNVTGITAVAAGGSHSLALQGGATVVAWGDNEFGQLGDTTAVTRSTAALVQGLSSVTRIAAGGGHSLAISDVPANGTAYAWGYNGHGQLGQNSVANSPSAVAVTKTGSVTLTNVIDIAAGGSHSLFLDSVGTVWACGNNVFGQLGNGNATSQSVAVQVTGLTGVPLQVAAGLDHSLAIIDDGTGQNKVWAWGYNFFGQLGNGAAVGNVAAVTTPAPVLTSLIPIIPLTDIVKIVAIGHHNLALDSHGQVWAWGDNTFGQLGNGTQTSSSLAIRVNTLTTNSRL